MREAVAATWPVLVDDAVSACLSNPTSDLVRTVGIHRYFVRAAESLFIFATHSRSYLNGQLRLGCGQRMNSPKRPPSTRRPRKGVRAMTS